METETAHPLYLAPHAACGTASHRGHGEASSNLFSTSHCFSVSPYDPLPHNNITRETYRYQVMGINIKCKAS